MGLFMWRECFMRIWEIGKPEGPEAVEQVLRNA